MQIHIPDTIKEYEPELRFFVDAMVQKLNVNRHKGFVDGVDVNRMIKLAEGEMEEMKAAHMGGESQFDFFLECVDVANMVWLAGLLALRMTKKEWTDSQPGSRSRIDRIVQANTSSFIYNDGDKEHAR